MFLCFGWLTNPKYGGAILPVFNHLYRIDSKMGQRSSTDTVWGNATHTITKGEGTCNIKILLSQCHTCGEHVAHKKTKCASPHPQRRLTCSKD